MITRFRETPPGHRVIVSTEAGSEGVNLQVANVLVNFDLPWNPMIVEQRIGRIQRLASEHDNVSIFNIMLKGTFEEYIVGRLMQKLQMAAHAIGDIEALLQGSDVDGDGEGDNADSFEDRILSLVLAALAERNVDRDVALAMQSIEDAKRELEREEANLNAMLGSMDGTGYVGPRAPTLPSTEHSMEPKTFALSALRMLGASVREERPGIFLAESKDSHERIHFDGAAPANQTGTLYAPQTPAFQRLVKRSIASGLHNVVDARNDTAVEAERLTRKWVEEFGAKVRSLVPNRVHRSFNGKALLRVRATVAHDSYERLVPVECRNIGHTVDEPGLEGLATLPKNIRPVTRRPSCGCGFDGPPV